MAAGGEGEIRRNEARDAAAVEWMVSRRLGGGAVAVEVAAAAVGSVREYERRQTEA